MCQGSPLSYPEISVISVQLPLEINFSKYRQDKYIVNTPLFEYFGLGKAPSFSLSKFWRLGNLKRKYVRAEYQRATQPHISLRKISFFSVLGLQTNQKKLLKFKSA